MNQVYFSSYEAQGYITIDQFQTKTFNLITGLLSNVIVSTVIGHCEKLI